MNIKVVIVVKDGKVQHVFSEENVAVEIIDFDSIDDEENKRLAEYVDICRETLYEINC